VLDDEVAVEKDRLRLGEVRRVAVQVLPAHLHHPDPGVGEVVHAAEEEVGARDEVRIEDGDQVALRGDEALLQRAGLEAAPVVAVQVGDVDPGAALPLDQRSGDPLRLVRRVVEDLDLQPLPRVFDRADGLDETLHHVHLIEDG